MRPQQNRRIRGRNNNNNGNNRRGPNPLTRNYESNGPDVKIRGNAQHIADKYVALARDVQAAGDRVMAENYLQHAEHYMRIILSAQPQLIQPVRNETLYEEGDDTNIVDLTLTENGAAILNEDGNEDENLLKLVVNRQDGDDKKKQEASGQAEEDAEGAATLPQPKLERTRRMARRRMPQQVATRTQVTVSTSENEVAHTTSAEKIDTPFLLTPSIVPLPLEREDAEVERVIRENDDAALVSAPKASKSPLVDKASAEKPRRRRRSVKNVSDDSAVQE